MNTIVCDDALNALSEMSDNSIPLTVFSPPYDDIRTYGNNWTLDYPALGRELLRVTADGGMCVVVLGDSARNFAKSLTTFRWAVDWVDNAGWRLFECCIYSRPGRPGAWWNTRFRVDHEYILMFLKGDRPRYFNKTNLMVDTLTPNPKMHGTVRQSDGSLKRMVPKTLSSTKCRGTVWKYAPSSSERNKTKLLHPATFPDKLAGDIIECFSQPGDTVLDPMCGSGTTCVMAAKMGRNYIGIDVNQDYCDIANNRIRMEIRNG